MRTSKPARIGTARTRRAFLKTSGHAVLGAVLGGAVNRSTLLAAPAVIRGRLGKARPRPDLLDTSSPAGLGRLDHDAPRPGIKVHHPVLVRLTVFAWQETARTSESVNGRGHSRCQDIVQDPALAEWRITGVSQATKERPEMSITISVGLSKRVGPPVPSRAKQTNASVLDRPVPP